MAGNSRTVQLAFANWLRGTAMPTAPTSLILALSTTVILDDGTNFTEPTTGYARQALTLSAPVFTEGVGSTVSNSNAIVFGPASASWGTVVSAAVLDQTGAMLFHGTFAAVRSVPLGDTVSFGIGTLEFNVK
jgi:hypothetical protein